MRDLKAEIGVIGGSGFYSFFTKSKEITLSTPYGKPSDKITLGTYKGKRVAFLPRHGKKHQFPPHKVPYRANLYAFKKLGIKRVIAPTAAGSLQSKIKPGHFVICDQFIDRTKKRRDTFYNGPKTIHVGMADPYCPELRKLAISLCRKLKIPVHPRGTVVIIEGPRFSTRAESRWFSKLGWEVINMTQYPEIVLARELEMCYVNISLVTDYDVGIEEDKKVKPVTAAEVLRVFRQNNEKVKKLILAMLNEIPSKARCHCDQILKEAVS